MSHILSLDQGTTSSRAILFDHAGTPVAVAQKEFPQIFPQPGWVEHDASTIWATQFGVAAEVLTKALLHPSDIDAIGITNQRETTVVWDRETGRVVHTKVRRPRRPLEEYLRRQGRFRHLFEPVRQDATLAALQARVDAYWEAAG